MNEEPESTRSPVADLSSLERDLARSLQPSWVQNAGPSENMARMADRYGDSERPARGKGGRDGRPSRGTPRGDGPRGRSPGDRRDKRDRNVRAPVSRPQPPEKLGGWDVIFHPDPRGMEGIAKQIKTSGKAYALFDIARLVLAQPERYLVEIKKSEATARTLWQVRVDGSLWNSRREAEAHALSKHLDKFYTSRRVETEPPKGNYTCIARCGMSGALLGPPNHHEYQTKVRDLHAKRFANMSLEAFKNRIQMVHEEAVIQQWKDEQSHRLEYHLLSLENEGADAPTGARTSRPRAGESADGDVRPPLPEDNPNAEGAAPTPNPTVGQPSVEPEPASNAEGPTPESKVEEVATPPAESSPAVEAESTAPDAESPATDSTTSEPDQGQTFSTFAELEAHFRKNFSEIEIVEIGEAVTIPGAVATATSTAPVVNLVRGACEDLIRFPLPLAHVIGEDLHRRGLQVFKSPQKILHACVARPKPLDAGDDQLSDNLKRILQTLAAHPNARRIEQWKALSAGLEDEASRTALASDLGWLIGQGHVVDYAGRGFDLPRKEPKKISGPRQERRPAVNRSPDNDKGLRTNSPQSLE